MRPFAPALLLLLFSLQAGAQEEFNPREQGSIEADLSYDSTITVSQGSLETLDQYIYALPTNYSSLVVNSDSHEIATDSYGNKQLVLKWQGFSGGNYQIRMRVKNTALIEPVPVVAFPYTAPRAQVEFIESTEYARVTDEIRAQAQEIVAGSKTGFEAVSRLSSWVYQNVDYQIEFGGDLYDSTFVFSERVGTCDEFANLFIAMARSVGIPARYVAGVVYSPGGWGYHAWAEVYLDKWVPVDPTWDEVGWLDATHIRLGHFKDASEVLTKGKWTYSQRECLDGKCPSATVESPRVSLQVSSAQRLAPLFDATFTVYPQEIGLGDSAVVEATIKSNAQGCLGTSTKVVSRVDDRGRNVLSVSDEKSLQLCPGEVKKAHFVLTARSDLNPNALYYNLADVFTFLGPKEILDLKINPRNTRESKIDLEVDSLVLEEGSSTNYRLVTNAPEYRVYSDLKLSNGTLTAESQGRHYLLAIASTGDLAQKEVSVPSRVDFFIKNVQKPAEVDCNSIVSVSMEIENVSSDEGFELSADVSRELEPIAPRTLVIGTGSSTRLVLQTRVSEKCSGEDQFVDLKVNGQRVFEKITVKDPVQEQVIRELSSGVEGLLEALGLLLLNFLEALGKLLNGLAKSFS